MPGDEAQRERELAIRRENERKDLEVEADHSERPLEGLSAAPTDWTPDQDEREAEAVHGDDEARSETSSRLQLDQLPPPGQAGEKRRFRDADDEEGGGQDAPRADPGDAPNGS